MPLVSLLEFTVGVAGYLVLGNVIFALLAPPEGQDVAVLIVWQ